MQSFLHEREKEKEKREKRERERERERLPTQATVISAFRETFLAPRWKNATRESRNLRANLAAKLRKSQLIGRGV